MAHGPNPAHCLVLKVKLHQNTAMFICLCVMYSCFFAINAELSNCDKTGSQSLRYLFSGLLQKKFADSALKVNTGKRECEIGRKMINLI